MKSSLSIFLPYAILRCRRQDDLWQHENLWSCCCSWSIGFPRSIQNAEVSLCVNIPLSSGRGFGIGDGFLWRIHTPNASWDLWLDGKSFFKDVWVIFCKAGGPIPSFARQETHNFAYKARNLESSLLWNRLVVKLSRQGLPRLPIFFSKVSCHTMPYETSRSIAFRFWFSKFWGIRSCVVIDL